MLLTTSVSLTTNTARIMSTILNMGLVLIKCTIRMVDIVSTTLIDLRTTYIIPRLLTKGSFQVMTTIPAPLNIRSTDLTEHSKGCTRESTEAREAS
ncbi:hypothetical protein QCA50_005176 [Cerrena zonata]|uniref:Uncharacterized protein n=1 Tax=Cerrena zonata TaxID=2478898 RepID=A0AAW0GNG6_9APHY